MKILAWIIVLALVIWGIFALVNNGGSEDQTANVNDAVMTDETADGADTMTDETADGATATEGESMAQ